MARKTSNRDLIMMIVMVAIITLQAVTIYGYTKLTDRQMKIIRDIDSVLTEAQEIIRKDLEQKLLEQIYNNIQKELEESCNNVQL